MAARVISSINTHVIFSQSPTQTVCSNLILNLFLSATSLIFRAWDRGWGGSKRGRRGEFYGGSAVRDAVEMYGATRHEG
eukprot:534250-Amorphochlora_amoeboformis.AAC.1